MSGSLLSQEHLETGGSIHESKVARIINDLSEQWPGVFPWFFSPPGTVSCWFLGGMLPGTFLVYRTSLSFTCLFLCHLRFSVTSFFQFLGVSTVHAVVSCKQ
jgi:hypothetical protein